MFSLIITVISIALVAALALATLYYGGTAFESGASRAQAAKILLQGQQLLGAADLYYNDNRQWPANIDQLVTGNYLKQIPNAQASGLNEAVAAGKLWAMVPNNPTFVVATDTKPVCAEVNLAASLKQKAILKQAYSGLIAQCYGSSDAALYSVFRKNTDAAFQPGADISTAAAPPTDPADPGWLTAPGAGTTQPASIALAYGVTITPSGAFGEVLVNSVKTRSLTVTNAGTETVTVYPDQIGVLTASGGFDSSTGSCNPSAVLAPTQSCVLNVTVNAGATPGPLTAVLIVELDLASGPYLTPTIPLSASVVTTLGAVSAPAAVTLAPSPVDLGSSEFGANQTAIITVTRSGPGPLVVGDLSRSSADNAFSVSNVDCPSSLPQDAVCNLQATFRPKVLGLASTTFTIAGKALTLSGTGLTPTSGIGVYDQNGVWVLGTQVDLGPLNVGTTPNPVLTFTVKNLDVGTAYAFNPATNYSNVAAYPHAHSGAIDADPLVFQSTTCSGSLAPAGSAGSSCTATFRYDIVKATKALQSCGATAGGGEAGPCPDAATTGSYGVEWAVGYTPYDYPLMNYSQKVLVKASVLTSFGVDSTVALTDGVAGSAHTGSFQMQNRGAAAAVTVTTDAGITASGCANVAAGASCSVNVSYVSKWADIQSISPLPKVHVTVRGVTYDVQPSANVISGITLAPTFLDMGTGQRGVDATSTSVLTNGSLLPLPFTYGMSYQGTNSQFYPFNIVGFSVDASQCVSPLAAGASCTFTAHWKPNYSLRDGSYSWAHFGVNTPDYMNIPGIDLSGYASGGPGASGTRQVGGSYYYPLDQFTGDRTNQSAYITYNASCPATLSIKNRNDCQLAANQAANPGFSCLPVVQFAGGYNLTGQGLYESYGFYIDYCQTGGAPSSTPAVDAWGPAYSNLTNEFFNNAFYQYSPSCNQSDPGARNQCQLAFMASKTGLTCQVSTQPRSGDPVATLTHMHVTCL